MEADLILLSTLVDEWLALTAHRELWTTEEVTDRLLDIRNAIPREETAGV